MGPQAVAELRRALATEAIVEQRFRMLEVADTVTQDLRSEVEYALADDNSKIRRAGFRLVERLKQDDMIPMIVHHAADNDPQAAKGAIASLAALGSPRAVEALLEIRKTAQGPRVLIALCQALGQVGDEVCIEALAGILNERKFLFFGHRWEDQIRSTAATALKQLPHPLAAEVLTRFVKDSDPRVRSIARGAAGQGS